MSAPPERDLESVRKSLRHQLQDGAERVSITAPAARLMLDELGRLLQSSERLRRQNRRLRRRLLEATGEVVADEPEPLPPPDAVP